MSEEKKLKEYEKMMDSFYRDPIENFWKKEEGTNMKCCKRIPLDLLRNKYKSNQNAKKYPL